MATQKLNLTRDQLATFLKNHEQIKQFEKLFALADTVDPAIDTLGIELQAGNAEATANEALAQLQRIANALEFLATAPVIQNNNSVATDYIDFSTTAPAPAIRVGRLHWNGGYTLNLEMTPNVNQSIGESQYYYIKASAAITKGQLVMFDGSVGSSGVLQGKPSTGVTNGQYIMGVASEDIANNAFGLVSSFGLVRGFDTTGAPYGEVWADGDILYYNPSYAGGLTKNIPTAPTPHVVVAAVVNAGPAGSGSVFVRVQAEPLVSQLSDVFLSGVANGDLLQYDSVQQRWENAPASTLSVGTATNLAGGAAGSVPYQSASSTTAMLPIGASGRWLGSSGTLPQWNAPAALTKTDDTNVTLTLGGSASTALLNAASLTLGWTGTLAASRGGTGFGSYAVGDILYADTTTTLAKLPDVATGNALISGGVGVAPSWGKIGLTTHVTGTLPVANGGTGITSLGTGVATWLGTPSSANLAAAVTDETGSGALVFGTAPTIADLTVTGTSGNVFSGAYTPTQVSTNTNVDSVTFSEGQYLRVGNTVTVSGQIVIDATTATTDTVVKMSIPVASNFSATRNLGGTGASIGTPFVANALVFLAETTNDCVEIRLRPSVNTAVTYNFSFTYRIQ